MIPNRPAIGHGPPAWMDLGHFEAIRPDRGFGGTAQRHHAGRGKATAQSGHLGDQGRQGREG